MTYAQIRNIMGETGLKVTLFCKLIGIKRSTLYSYKCSRRPAGSTIRLLKLIEDDPTEIVSRLIRLNR